MPRTYNSGKSVPLRFVPQAVRSPERLNRKEVIARLQESLGALGTDWTPMHDFKEGAALLTKAFGPGWGVSVLRRLTKNGPLQQGVHWFRRGCRYSVDVVAIAAWYLNQEGEG